jgi:hypothetical protein
LVGVFVFVGVLVGVDVLVGVWVGVLVFVGVWVGVLALVGVCVGVFVGVDVFVAVGHTTVTLALEVLSDSVSSGSVVETDAVLLIVGQLPTVLVPVTWRTRVPTTPKSPSVPKLQVSVLPPG